MSYSTRTALWKDVKQKAYDLLINHKVDIDEISTYSALGTVQGDNDTYQTYVNNKATVYKDNDIDAANWFCTCPWGQWSNSGNRPNDGPDSTGTVKVNDRFCSHEYALYMILQQYRKMHKGGK